MSGQSFAFPPPPPPPPRRSSDSHETASRGRGYNTGARARGGSHRGRGHASFPGRGRVRGTQYGHNQQRSPHHPTIDARPQDKQRGNQAWGTNVQQKRDHNTAFGGDALRKSRPTAAPAIPSFSANLANILPPKPAAQSTTTSTRREPPRNALGLTPAANNQSDSEDDNDEESKLAQGGGQDLQFSYRGQSATLKTAAEIAAWIAERKRRYPTEAKREAARKEADERRKRWEAEKQARMEATRATRECRQQMNKRVDTSASSRTKPQASAAVNDPAAAVKLHAERLRRKALKVQRDLAAAEAQLEKHMNEASPAAERTPEMSSDDSLGILSESSRVSSDDDSSSSGSDSDNGGPPEAQSSKIKVPSAFEHAGPGSNPSKRPCASFIRMGKCRFGPRCHFSHERAAGPAKDTSDQTSQNPSKRGRKGLFQAMVEKEQDEEQRKLLTAIIALGKQGVLEPES